MDEHGVFIVDLPIRNGEMSHRYVTGYQDLPEGTFHGGWYSASIWSQAAAANQYSEGTLGGRQGDGR